MSWFNLLAVVQGTLKSLLQHQVQKHQVFGTQFSIHPYIITIGKTTALTRRTLVGKVMSLFLIHWLGWSYVFFQGASAFNSMAAFTTCSNFQFSSVPQLCPTLCDPVNCSTPGLPVHHQLPKFTQTHVHQVRDVIQPSHPLSAPSPPAPNPSQHQSLFQ